jgi:hypothetical protein
MAKAKLGVGRSKSRDQTTGGRRESEELCYLSPDANKTSVGTGRPKCSAHSGHWFSSK